MKPTYREKNLLDYLFGGFRSTLNRVHRCVLPWWKRCSGNPSLFAGIHVSTRFNLNCGGDERRSSHTTLKHMEDKQHAPNWHAGGITHGDLHGHGQPATLQKGKRLQAYQGRSPTILFPLIFYYYFFETNYSIFSETHLRNHNEKVKKLCSIVTEDTEMISEWSIQI